MDSISNTREFDIVKNGQSVYEMDKIDSEIKDLQTKKTERETTIKFLIWIMAIIFAPPYHIFSCGSTGRRRNSTRAIAIFSQ